MPVERAVPTVPLVQKRRTGYRGRELPPSVNAWNDWLDEQLIYLRYYGIDSPLPALSTTLSCLIDIGEKGNAWWTALNTLGWLIGLVLTTYRRFTRSCSVDHIVFTCPNLEDGIEYVYERTGVRAAYGGSHPGVGTHNALLALGDDVYLEIIAPDPKQREPKQVRPFGLDDPRTHWRFNAFAVHPTGGSTIHALQDDMFVHSFDPGSIDTMSRLKPDGTLLKWRMTTLQAAAGPRPWIIEWGRTPSPAASAPKGCLLCNLRCYGPFSAEMKHVLLKIMGLQRLKAPSYDKAKGIPPVVEFRHRELTDVPKHENNFIVATLMTPKGLVSFGEGYGR